MYSEGSAVEAAELLAIEERVTVKDGHAIAEYPFIKDPAMLQDNYEQVEKRALAVERRLERTGELEPYNEQWAIFIERGAISTVTEEEKNLTRALVLREVSSGFSSFPRQSFDKQGRGGKQGKVR